MKNLTRNSRKNEKQPKAVTFFTCNISAFNIWTRSIVKLKETKKVAVFETFNKTSRSGRLSTFENFSSNRLKS